MSELPWLRVSVTRSRRCVLAVGAVLALMLPGAPSRAADTDLAQENARQVVGLFLKSCVQFSGNRSGLLQWAKKTGLPELRDKKADAFLYGLPGMVYDAGTKDSRLVLVSEESGSCSAFSPLADGPLVIQELERILREQQVKLSVIGDKADTREKTLNHREYTASADKHEWQMLVSTEQAPSGGEAMLTANSW